MIDIANDNADDVLDVRGAMALLRVGKDAIYTMCGRQEIPHRKVGRALRFSRAALLRWLGGEHHETVAACGQQGAQQKGQ